jgi:hypothetical protein
MAQRQQPIDGKTRHELVNVTMRYNDYERLRSRGLSIDEQVSKALATYLKLEPDKSSIKEVQNDFSPEGYLITIRCALAKSLCNQVRELHGRFDLHTSEAVRLYLLYSNEWT